MKTLNPNDYFIYLVFFYIYSKIIFICNLPYLVAKLCTEKR